MFILLNLFRRSIDFQSSEFGFNLFLRNHVPYSLIEYISVQKKFIELDNRMEFPIGKKLEYFLSRFGNEIFLHVEIRTSLRTYADITLPAHSAAVSPIAARIIVFFFIIFRSFDFFNSTLSTVTVQRFYLLKSMY